jgi:hypothetical protein
MIPLQLTEIAIVSGNTTAIDVIKDSSGNLIDRLNPYSDTLSKEPLKETVESGVFYH